MILLLAVLAQDVRTTIPSQACALAPVLVAVQREHWDDSMEPWTLGGLVEQESCVSLRHSKCWNPHAELRTSREWGVGLGQLTIAYRADGSVRFNKFEELRREHQELRDWRWEDRYNPQQQLLAVVLMVRDLYRRQRGPATPTDHWAFTLSSYNGGMSGVLRDRLLCGNIGGCDPSRWFGHVELHSVKSSVAMPGYGPNRSPMAINREHARNILTLRRDKYRRFWI